MAAPITKLPVEQLPAGPAQISVEQSYWNHFGLQKSIQSVSSQPVTHISAPFSFSTPTRQRVSDEAFAVTAGARVQIYSTKTRKLLKEITRFKEIAHSGEVRRDGRVLVAGDDSGAIQVFDIGSRAILKTWEIHRQPVWTTKFSPTDLTTLMSTSDDRTIKLWDLTAPQPVTTFVGHDDYVRSGAFLAASGGGLLVSGSYDETVRIWDPREPARASMIFKHNAPVEMVLPMPSGTKVLASADNKVSILDLVAGKPLEILKNHQKTVTSLCLATGGTRLVTGSLDGHVKAYETDTWNVVAGLKYPSPILSLSVVTSGLTRQDKHLAVGMQSGMLSIRTRSTLEEQARAKEKEMEMQALVAGTVDDFDKKSAKKRSRGLDKKMRGRDFRGEGAHIIIDGTPTGKTKTEARWERELRKANYGSALDLVLNEQMAVSVVYTLFVALRHRAALRRALQDRDEVTLQPILIWLIKYITDPRYVEICVEVALEVFNLYGGYMGMSSEIDHLVTNLHGRVRKEVARSQQAIQTEGMLSMLLLCDDDDNV